MGLRASQTRGEACSQGAPALWLSYEMLHRPDFFLSAVGYSFGSCTPQKIQSTAWTCALDKEAAERLCPDLSASSGPGA